MDKHGAEDQQVEQRRHFRATKGDEVHQQRATSVVQGVQAGPQWRGAEQGDIY